MSDTKDDKTRDDKARATADADDQAKPREADAKTGGDDKPRAAAAGDKTKASAADDKAKASAADDKAKAGAADDKSKAGAEAGGKAAPDDDDDKPRIYPVLPLRDVVIYPGMVVPLFVGRAKSVRALDSAMDGDKRIMLVTQKNADDDDPVPDDIYRIGTRSNIIQMLKLPDGTLKLLAEGESRRRVRRFIERDDYLAAEIEPMPERPAADDKHIDALSRSVVAQFGQYAKLHKKAPGDLLNTLAGMDDPARLADTVAAHMPLRIAEKQRLLETDDTAQRLERLLKLIKDEIDILEMEARIRDRVKRQMEKSQREYYLNEQMKAIQKELGGAEEGSESDEYGKRIEKSGMPKEARARATSEVNKLGMMSPTSAEATVVRNYLDWLLSMPWKKRTRLKDVDLRAAKGILDEDHYGLEKIKDRILEYLAVQQRVKKIKGPILCLVGPPGVGKTSLGRSIARATGRKFARMSLGGVRDEAEIRGHRRTYVGALPGKIIQNLAKVKVRNPLFLLDEVDKMSMDFRGDPASALLEVLDAEQNNTFQDHYLEVEFDLSDVMFVCTANSLRIPPALFDRMEVINIAGYTEQEKIHIAENYLAPRSIKENGLRPDELAFSKNALRDIIRYYTREAGVRGLEREIAKICRKVVKNVLMEETPAAGPVRVGSRLLARYLGVRRYRYGLAEQENQIGQATGLAWTEVGGDLLTVETAVMPGRGKTKQTGKLGDVMRESIDAAVTVVRSRSATLGIARDFYETADMHVHVPEGATPKDGPSAGVAICLSLISTLTRIPVRADVAMTGEITLRGEILPIGGLKQKLLAAMRGGIKTVLIPHENRKDLKEMPAVLLRKLDIRPIRWIDEAIETALCKRPTPRDDARAEGRALEEGDKSEGQKVARH